MMDILVNAEKYSRNNWVGRKSCGDICKAKYNTYSIMALQRHSERLIPHNDLQKVQIKS